ncbi:MAG: hypothetical protein AAFR12_15665 [Cyanobacteria bacterium J06626_6]
MKLNHWILFFSGIVSALIASTAYNSPTVAQINPHDGLPQLSTAVEVPELADPATSVIPANPAITVTEVAQQPPREPMMTMPVSEAGNVTVQIVNETEETLVYQALGDTEPRTIDASGLVTLQNLRVPATVTFSFATIDRNRQTATGLTKAELKPGPGNDMVQLVIKPTTDLDSEVSALTVESNGNIFVL